MRSFVENSGQLMESDKITEIVVTLSFEGIHCWPECPFEEVAFLRSPHRHIFTVQALAEVRHSDRDIEIIMLKRSIQRYLRETYGDPCQLGRMSCEMLAGVLADQFGLSSCTVLEDGENGAKVTTKTQKQ